MVATESRISSPFQWILIVDHLYIRLEGYLGPGSEHRPNLMFEEALERVKIQLTISIASRPNAFAAMTICDLVNSNSCLEGVRMMEVSAQSMMQVLIRDT